MVVVARNVHIRCPWCNSPDVKAVKQHPYVHFICQNRPECSHEWDDIYDTDVEKLVLDIYK